MPMNVKLLAVTLVLLGAGGVASAQSPATDKGVMEITRKDLFATHEWNSRDVSILGVQLGTTLAEAERLVSAEGFILKCLPNGNGKAGGLRCPVDFPPDVSTTVAFAFNREDRVSRMYIDQAPTYIMWNKHQISRKRLGGYTYKLVNCYSDALREKLLGQPDAVEEKKQPYFGPEFTYSYNRIGLILVVAALPEMTGKVGPPKYTRRELDELIFVPPGRVATSDGSR
jgi:hypothetical protein